MEDKIKVQGSRVHNLKNIDVDIPRNKLVVITGLSGSGKSSLAFDTIYAEGQRRYVETFSAYARQFLGSLERPDVDKINGLSPVIAIEQKTSGKNPRSTVGTITEIYDFFRLLFARVSEAYSYNTGEKMIKYSNENMILSMVEEFSGKKVAILAPVVQSRKGHYRELFSSIMKQGFSKVRVDSEFIDLKSNYKVDRYKTHDIEIVIDRLEIDDNSVDSKRLAESINTALYHGNGMILIYDYSSENLKYYSRNLMCPSTGISYALPEPNSFSFNSPKGMCKKCNGLGYNYEVNEKKIIPDKSISINMGGILPIGEKKNNWTFRQIEAIGERYGFSLADKISDIPEEALNIILNGGNESFSVKSKTLGLTRTYKIEYDGVIPFLEYQFKNGDSTRLKRWAKNFMDKVICTNCNGSRLKKESLYFKIDNKNISELSKIDIIQLNKWVKSLKNKLSKKQFLIAKEVLSEIEKRISFLIKVGLDYLSLSRGSKTLSGGESQRIRLATQIGSKLVGVLYILDEPSIGLHQRDNNKLIESLIELKNIGNSIIVVEHDKDIMKKSDYIIDLGPGAGEKGGKIIAASTPSKMLKKNTQTADYLSGRKVIEIPKSRRKGNGKFLSIFGCNGNNLKNIDVSFPLGSMIGVTGVSGSGKSTLINDTLYPILNQHFFKSIKKPLKFKSIKGIENLDKVIDINQLPIGRTPRSNPATYTGVFGEIRALFTKTPEAMIRGYKPGRFSFNVKGGRCETCQGAGVKTIEMNFLPDVYVDCDVCFGKRFNEETLQIKYRNKSINDILNMTISDACNFFKPYPKIFRKLKTIKDVGLGYITLGQKSTTLSGGEAQRIKLATELSKKDTGQTLYILDEPTTGLHFDDVRVLMNVLNKLVDRGNTMIIVEHNLDVIKQMDYIVDLGPEGGKKGGRICCVGTPEKISAQKNNYTGKFLKNELIT